MSRLSGNEDNSIDSDTDTNGEVEAPTPLREGRLYPLILRDSDGNVITKTPYGIHVVYRAGNFTFYVVKIDVDPAQFRGQFSYPQTDIGSIYISKNSTGWRTTRNAIPKEILNDEALEGWLEEVVLDLLNSLPTIEEQIGGPYRFFLMGDPRYFVPRRLADAITEEERFFALKAVRAKASVLYNYKSVKGFWKEDGDTVIRAYGASFLEDLSRDRHVDEAVSLIRDLNYIDQEDVDANPVNKNKIVLGNCVLDLETMETEDYDPEMYALSGLPVYFNPDADCPEIKKFVEQITKDDEDAQTLQEWVGYHLLKDNRFNKCLMLVGDGANGKSTFLNLLGNFLGKENVRSMNLRQLTGYQFAPARLYGKLANLAADVSAKELKYTGMFKQLCGEDLIECQIKFGGTLIFRNYAKPSFSANRLPPTEDMTDAFFRRWLIVSFPFKFEGEACDPRIIEKITTEEELSGLLNWAIEGVTRLLENGGFTTSGTTEEIQRRYELYSNPYGAFVQSCLFLKFDARTSGELTYDAYFQFCRAVGFSPVGKQTFDQHLKNHVQNLKKVRMPKDETGKRAWGWRGFFRLCDLMGDTKIARNLHFTLTEEEEKEFQEALDTRELYCKDCKCCPGEIRDQVELPKWFQASEEMDENSDQEG